MLKNCKTILVASMLVVGSLCEASEELLAFNICCEHCSPDQEIWTSMAGAWNMSLSGELLLDFRSPPAFLLDDQRRVTSEIFGREYVTSYGGAPVSLTYQSVALASPILNSQYAEYDLLETKSITGVTIQGGFILDENEELFWQREIWVTKFMVSYSTGGSFRYVKSGSVAVFEGNTNAEDAVVRSLPEPIKARMIRIHPITAEDSDGNSVTTSLFRAAPVVCSEVDEECPVNRFNCHLNAWQKWGECTCDWAGCTQKRVRKVARYEACGGSQCENTDEWRACVIPTPAWQIIAIGVGVGLILLLILLIAIIIPVKRYLDGKQPEFVFKKDEKREKKKKKERTLRDDLAVNEKPPLPDDDLEEEDFEDMDDENVYPTDDIGTTFNGSKKSKKKVTFDSNAEIRSIKDDTPMESPRDFPTDATPRDVNVRAEIVDPVPSIPANPAPLNITPLAPTPMAPIQSKPQESLKPLQPLKPLGQEPLPSKTLPPVRHVAELNDDDDISVDDDNDDMFGSKSANQDDYGSLYDDFDL